MERQAAFMKKTIYLAILFVLFFGFFFGIDQSQQSKSIFISPEEAKRDLQIAALQKMYQQAFTHSFVVARVQLSEAADITIAVHTDSNRQLQHIHTVKSSGNFQLDQIARTVIADNRFWLQADKNYEIQFHYDPNWDYGTSERLKVSSGVSPSYTFSNNSLSTLSDSNPLVVEPVRQHEGPVVRTAPLPINALENEPQSYRSYQSIASAKVLHLYQPPTGFEQVPVTAQFSVLPEGKIADLRIINSSNIPEVDRALLQAIHLAVPFNVLPLKFPKQGFPVVVAIGSRGSVTVREMNDYIHQLKVQVYRNWNPPSSIGDRRVLISFTIDETGHLFNIRLVRSSGDTTIDSVAYNAVKNAGTLPPLPASMRGHRNGFIWDFDKNTQKFIN
jgi:TonB family protein